MWHLFVPYAIVIPVNRVKIIFSNFKTHLRFNSVKGKFPNQRFIAIEVNKGI